MAVPATTEALSGWIHDDVLRGDDRGSTEEIEVEIADNTRVRVYRSTITAVLAKTEPAKES